MKLEFITVEWHGRTVTCWWDTSAHRWDYVGVGDKDFADFAEDFDRYLTNLATYMGNDAAWDGEF